MNKNTISTMKPASFSEKFNLRNATSIGGANLLADYALDVLKLPEIFRDHLSLQKAPNAIYPLADSLTAYTLASAIGMERVFHLKSLENDPLLRAKTGWDKLPDATTFYVDIHRFTRETDVNSLRTVNKEILQRILPEKCILDIDATVETVYGNQEYAAVGYNPTKHGRKSYHPLMFFEGKSQAMVNAVLRGGSVSSSDEFTEAFQQTLAILPEQSRLDYVRVDAGFAGEEIYAQLEANTRKGYVAKIKRFSDLWHHAACFPWRRVEYTDLIVEVKSFLHQAKSWSRPRRIVMVRYHSQEASPIQGQLFQDWHTAAMVTNLDWAEEDIWRFYNQRCAQENYIKEMKRGFGMDRIPTQDFLANYAVLLLKGIAYNLVLSMKSEIATYRFSRMTAIRLRRELFQIPAVIVYHARRLILRLMETYRYQTDYLIMRQRLEALK
jgi:hypothetical protein